MTEIVCAGSARLRREREALAYDEAVSFWIEGKRIAATRAYRFSSAGSAIVAMFSDGAPFFTLRLDADGLGSASHRCGDDFYDLTLTLRAPNVWQTVWRVSGSKRLRITTDYEPSFDRRSRGNVPFR
jgi:hypothetical protein